MDNINPKPSKSFSFSKLIRDRDPDQALVNGHGRQGEGDSSPILKDPNPPPSLSQLSDEVDYFLCSLQSNPPPSDLPDCIFSLLKLVDTKIDKYNITGRPRASKFGQDPVDDKSFFEALDLISRLYTTLSDFPSNSPTSSALDKASSVLEKAMSFLDKELCILLENNKHDDFDQPKTPKKTHRQFLSFNSTISDSDLGISDNESPSPAIPTLEEFPGFSLESVSKMNNITTTMINAGYQIECYMTFTNLRRNTFKAVLQNLGYNTTNMEDIQRTQWDSLESQITTWTNVIWQCCNVLFSAELKFYDSVFPDQQNISRRLFSDLARLVIIRFLNFADAIAITKRSVERLFKFLDMYETLRDLEATIDDKCYEEKCAQELAYEIASAKGTLGDAVVSMFFCDLENCIERDNERNSVPNGTVHPLTRYVMNYLDYVCEYKDILEQVIEQRVKKIEEPRKTIVEGNDEDKTGMPARNSAFGVQVMKVMELLDGNVERKSEQYRDEALRCVFLMNNRRYMVQKIKGSTLIRECMGDNWCRRRQSQVKQYHKNYKRETWGKLLESLSHVGLKGNEKVVKPLVKERFKAFNAMFEEIHKTQSTWVVYDEQLRTELRVSISSILIPAYRAFWGRFKNCLDPKQVEKYIKYQPDDIEALVEQLFNGNTTSMGRRRA